MYMRRILTAIVACVVVGITAGDDYCNGSGASSYFKIAYGVMVYERPTAPGGIATLAQFDRLMQALYTAEHVYVVHVDVKSSVGLREGISSLISQWPNVYEIPSVGVSWSGISVVERTLALMQEALSKDSEWQWFVNLGQEDYPIASHGEMRAFFDGRKDLLSTNFIKCWPLERHSFFGQEERHGNRVRDVFVDNFHNGVASAYGSKRDPAPTGMQFYKSLQQTLLSRDFCSYALFSVPARRIGLYLANSQAPDELFFPTVLQSSPTFAASATCDDTRHFSHWLRPGGSWHPEYLTMLHLPLLLRSDEFFARKASPQQNSTAVMDVLDVVRDAPPGRHGLAFKSALRVHLRLHAAAEETHPSESESDSVEDGGDFFALVDTVSGQVLRHVVDDPHGIMAGAGEEAESLLRAILQRTAGGERPDDVVSRSGTLRTFTDTMLLLDRRRLALEADIRRREQKEHLAWKSKHSKKQASESRRRRQLTESLGRLDLSGEEKEAIRGQLRSLGAEEAVTQRAGFEADFSSARDGNQ